MKKEKPSSLKKPSYVEGDFVDMCPNGYECDYNFDLDQYKITKKLKDEKIF